MIPTLAATERTKLKLYPSSGPMGGGNTVYLFGPCFTADMKIECLFGNKVIKSDIILILKAFLVFYRKKYEEK